MDNSSKKIAPVAVFAYNRLDNTRQTIESLKNNYLAKETDVFIFSDAPKTKKNRKAVDGVRRYLKTITGFKSVTIIERKENFYIERNIIEGVNEIVNRYGKIIVLEDDGISARNFLTFMNNALDFYEKETKVMHVATFTFIKMPDNYNKTFFWRYSENTGGGWGTWKNRWDKFKWFQNEAEGLTALTDEQKKSIELDGVFNCLASLRANPIPWDICWYIAIVRNNGLAVNSPKPLIKNSGLFNGTHFSSINRILGKSPFDIELGAEEDIILENKIVENMVAVGLLKDFYSKIGKRKRDKVLHLFLRMLVTLRITKLFKLFLK